MCGRYALETPPEAIRKLLDFTGQPNFPAQYNIAPTQAVPILRDTPRREMALVQWGLVPSWAKPDQIADGSFRPQINARSETVLEKASFTNAFRRRRCLMPADAFYEWDRKTKQPYCIRRRDRGLFMMAAIWELWSGADGSEIEGCAVLTMAANDALTPVHHRMPVMLPRTAWDEYLAAPETEAARVAALCAPTHDDFEAIPVSTRVNKVANNEPSLWDREEIIPPAQQMDLF